MKIYSFPKQNQLFSLKLYDFLIKYRFFHFFPASGPWSQPSRGQKAKKKVLGLPSHRFSSLGLPVFVFWFSVIYQAICLYENIHTSQGNLRKIHDFKWIFRLWKLKNSLRTWNTLKEWEIFMEAMCMQIYARRQFLCGGHRRRILNVGCAFTKDSLHRAGHVHVYKDIFVCKVSQCVVAIAVMDVL